jgi:DNA polymerase III delta prime subunit
MQTFLIHGSNLEAIEIYIKKVMTTHAISPFDYDEIIPNPTIGIDSIRLLKQKCILKPSQSKYRLIVIKEMEKATIQAQQAMLKILEEPPANTFIILTCTDTTVILSTILSRCEIISLSQENNDSQLAQNGEIQTIYKVCRMSKGQRIIFAADYAKDKQESILFLNNVKRACENLLYQDNSLLTKKQIGSLLQKTQAAIRFIDSNSNTRATLDIFFLGFPQMK